MPNPADMPGAQAPPVEPPAAPVAPAAVEPPAAPPAPEAATPKPPWGSDEEFNPQRAWDLIQNLQKDKADLKSTTDPIVAEHEALRRASMEDNERLTEDLSKVSEREQVWRTQAVQAKAEALAAGRFKSTAAAVKLAGDLSAFASDEGIDTTKLTARLDEVAVEYPFLVTEAPAQGLRPNKAQGQSGTGPIPLDMQIKAAQERGDLATSIALKQQMKYAKP